MGIVNLTPDSFFAASRAGADDAPARIGAMFAQGADMVDLGAVSTRPGATAVRPEEEWQRLEPVLKALASGEVAYPQSGQPQLPDAGALPRISIDTTCAQIVRRAYRVLGPFIVNDISAGEDDPEMLSTVAELGLPYVAMHKRGNPRSMDSLCDYPQGVVQAVLDYFEAFAGKAAAAGISNWIVDPGFGFAKTIAQNYELLAALQEFRRFGRPVLVGVADKRFTREIDSFLPPVSGFETPTERIHLEALRLGADILRVHDVKAAVRTLRAAAL